MPDGDKDTQGGDGAYPLPKGSFDPLQATLDELTRYGLPPRPDPETQPLLYRAFASVFSPPLTFVNPDIEEFELIIVQPISQPAPPTGVPSPSELSKNWCGGYIEPREGRMFVQITGRWTVPDPSLPPLADRVQPEADTIYKCSTWIGLDGQEFYLDSSLPQIGTEQFLPTSGGLAGARAWFQWWARHETKMHRKYLSGVPVAPYDEVSCMIWVKDPERVHAFFRNHTTGKIAPVTNARSPAVKLPEGPEMHPRVAGATAEWVMERPAIPVAGLAPPPSELQLYPFPQYDPLLFHDCIGGVARVPGPPEEAAVLSGTRFLRLIEARRNPQRLAIISMPAKTNDISLQVRSGSFR